jgi:hypothetical protein
MIEFQHTNPDHCDPPGAYKEILEHPIYRVTKAIEKVTIKEHRFAFFYWVKWYRELEKKLKSKMPPSLISIDYHRDLARSSAEFAELKGVEGFNLSELAMFCWARMNPLNNGHILSAAYINIIGDILLLKQQKTSVDPSDLVFEDKFKNKHHIYEFENIDDLKLQLNKKDISKVFFDIDLDYFIEKEGVHLKKQGWKLMSEDKIREIINPKSLLFKWIYERIEGITIATEPGYCGGLLNSYKIYSIIDEQLFDRDGHWRL